MVRLRLLPFEARLKCKNARWNRSTGHPVHQADPMTIHKQLVQGQLHCKVRLVPNRRVNSPNLQRQRSKHHRHTLGFVSIAMS